jgi:hypothetical protein
MRRYLAVLSALCVLALAFTAWAVTPDNPKIMLKEGDTVYACGCGKDCPCKALSMQAAKCPCGKDMVKSTVTKVEGDTAVVKVNGEDQTFPTKGKYVCGCGASCPCNFVSQTAGKCACNKDLVPAK